MAGGIFRPAYGRRCTILFGLGLIAATTACNTQIEEIRLRINEDEKGALVAMLSAPTSSNNMQEADISVLTGNELEQSTGYQTLNQVASHMVRCKLEGRIYQRRAQMRLDLRGAFEDVEELNSILRCSAQTYEEPSVEFERHEGFFSDNYVTRLSITQLAFRCGTPREPCRPGTVFPRLITLTIPGRFVSVQNQSEMIGLNVVPRQVDGDTVQFQISPTPDFAARNARYFAQHRTARTRRDMLRLEISSNKPKYDLGTIISVVGMIFGSGLLLQISRWLLRRREEKRKEAKPGTADA